VTTGAVSLAPSRRRVAVARAVALLLALGGVLAPFLAESRSRAAIAGGRSPDPAEPVSFVGPPPRLLFRRSSPVRRGAAVPDAPSDKGSTATAPAATAPAAEATAPPAAERPPAAEPANVDGGKRLKQFLALEPLDDDPGNQWEKDMQDSSLTAEEQRKKNTALITGAISLVFSFGYLLAVWIVENRDLSIETTLSAEDVATLTQSSSR